MSAKQKIPECWPGTNIVKSTGNGFTIRPYEMTPTEKGSLTSRQNAAKGHATQKKLGKGFGHATMGGLSKRAEAQLKNAPQSIRIGKKSDTTKRQKMAKAAI
jgi:hypothetical protein